MSRNRFRSRFFGSVVMLAGWVSISPIARAELIVHLTFDGHLEDDVGPNQGSMIDGGLAPIDNPTYVEGFDGTANGALRFDGNSVLIYEVAQSEGTLPLTDKPDFSIAMWVRSTLDGQRDLRVFSESTD